MPYELVERAVSAKTFVTGKSAYTGHLSEAQMGTIHKSPEPEIQSERFKQNGAASAGHDALDETHRQLLMADGKGNGDD